MEQLILDRIQELWRYRAWYRQHAYSLTWPVRFDHAVELRALVRLARAARRRAEDEAIAGTVWRLGSRPADDDQRNYPDWAAWQAAGPA